MLIFESEAICAILCGQWLQLPENRLNETPLYLNKLMMMLSNCIWNALLYM